MKNLFQRPQDNGIDHLERRRDHALSEDPAHSRAGVRDRCKDSHKGTCRFRQRHQAERRIGHEPQGPLGSHDEAHEIVATHRLFLAPDLERPAIGEDEMESEYVLGGDAILERVGTARVLRDVSSDGGGHLAGGIGREMQPVAVEALVELEVHDARLHTHAAPGGIGLDHTAQFGHGQNRSRGRCNCSPTQSRARAPRNPGNARVMEQLDCPDDLRCLRGEQNEPGAALMKGHRIGFIRQELRGTGEDSILPKHAAQARDEGA